MGWTSGRLQGAFTTRAVIEFDLGVEFAARVLDAVRYGTVIYAAVSSRDQTEVFGLVLLAERRAGLLYTKPISEDMGPAEDRCPARILDLLSEPSNEWAAQWRERCRARLGKVPPRKGETVLFLEELSFVNDEVHRSLVYEGGSIFRAPNGTRCRVPNWREREFQVQT
jgi:hypothetical protein